MLVVFPTPFTPTTKMTAGMPSGGCLGLGATPCPEPGLSRIARMTSSTAGRSWRVSVSLRWLTCCFRRLRISCVVFIPKSATMRVASRSLRTDSSSTTLLSTISSMRSTSWAFVEATACFSRSKMPGFFSFSSEPNRETIPAHSSLNSQNLGDEILRAGNGSVWTAVYRAP